ncbi:MAG: dockerin type I repeat-containing protein [Clostridia bacterium]|nr:dockerin type I repeat-containing protein [Clostridia bacterium]
MKKFLSALLAMLFALTAFGVSAIFSGFISAGAFYDYLIYTPIPGFSIYTNEELALLQNPYVSAGVNETIEGVGPVVTWTRTGSNSWGSAEIYGGYGRNMLVQNHKDEPNPKDFTDTTWAAMDTINGKTVMGDESFKGQDGLVFWVGINGEPYTGEVSVRIRQVPCTGPYFNGGFDNDNGDHTPEELQEYGIGFQYASRGLHPDANGYVHFEFKTDFYQSDWWSTDDEGIERQGDIYNGGQPNYWPVPKSKIAQISGFSFGISSTSVGDRISIGDIRMFRDSRVHTDELDEVMSEYDALNPEAFTEESYEAATTVYLEAYEVMNDPAPGEHYSQEEIDSIVDRLKASLKALEPMFMVKSETVAINGFEVLTDEDLEAISDGGMAFDAAMVTDEFVPEGAATQSLYVMGGAFDGDPSYGWSKFITAKLNDDDEIEAVKNVFGADNLDESAGLRFWIKYGESYTPAPTDMIIGVGSSTEGVYFECDSAAVQLPEDEGYVGVAWSAFYDYEGDAEIFDYLNSLDYISISIEGCAQKEYYLSDLHAFEWSINSASFDAMDKQIVDAQAYMATLNKDDWSVRSWQRVFEAIDTARALHETYAVTQQDVDKATAHINDSINWLTPRGVTPTQDELDALEAAYYNALTYWHGNYTGRSYADLKAELDYVSEYINDEMNTTACVDFTNRINTAVAGLVPITHGGTVTPTEATDVNGKAVTVKLFSIEDFSSPRDMNRANGHRKDDVSYDLVDSVPGLDLPAKALKMKPKSADLSSKPTDQHGALQFKLFDRYSNSITPDVKKTEDGNTIGGAIGDLSGSAGIRVWVGVNDVNLAQKAFFRFGVSNCTEGPLFERHAINIPFPASGSGWLYIPWDCFDFYDDWTKGEDINLAEIRFWIVRVDGEIPKDLEVYMTCVSAYTDQVSATNSTPVIKNVTDGQSIDVAGESFVPRWDTGTATLNGKRYIAGTPITKNDDYKLVIKNGDKQTEVNFTITGGEAADALPVVTGVKDGTEYDAPVTINWDVGEATLNGEAIEKGTEVSAPGSYLLQVVNGTKTTSVRFTIKDTTPPPPQVKKGDPTGNGKIEVDDALAALRVAAKLAEPTEELLAACDIDGNGKIEVDDALAILRVAAKLADESSLG